MTENQTPNEAPIVEPTPTETPDVPSTAKSLFVDDFRDLDEQPVVETDAKPTEVNDPPVESGSKPDPVQPATPQAPTSTQSSAPAQQPAVAAVQPPAVQQPQVQQPAPQKQLSQEEINKQLGVYTLTEKDYDAVFDTDDKAASINALNTILQNTARQALVMASHLVDQGRTAIQQEIAPYKQFADSYREQELKHTFFDTYPTLKGQDSLINLVITQLQHEGAKFNDNKQLFDEVAKRTNAAVQHLAVQGQGSPQPTVPSTTARPRMAPLSNGGQAGGAGTVAKTSGTNTAKSVFAS